MESIKNSNTMIKLHHIIKEVNEENYVITINDVDAVLTHRLVDNDAKRVLDIFHEYYYSEDENKQVWAKEYLQLLNNVLQRVILLIKNLNIPHVDGKFLKAYPLQQHEFFSNEKDFFPFPLYVSSNKNDENTVGILIDENGKVLEIHEGHDEATPETISLVNKLVHPQGKKVRIYGSHNRDLVLRINETDKLPANLYVSPDKGHAKSYMDIKGERETFTGIIDINSVNQESNLDWKTTSETRIEKFRFI